MTATVLLVRHAVHDRLGRVLCGRMPGVVLGAEGLAQAARLGRRLRGASAIYSSPAERARQTAAPIAAASGLEALVDPALDEIDFGAWTGARFDDLADDPSWQGWNNARDVHRPPGGESMQETQHRMAAWLAAVGACHEDGTVVAVSHADVIKAAVMAVLGLGVDAHAAFEVSPASVTRIVVGGWGSKLHSLNEAMT